MTFYVKRPGQDEGIPVGEEGEYDYFSGGLNAMRDDWSVYLPHKCGSWEVGYGSREEALADAHAFRAELDRAIAVLEQGGEQS